MAEEPSIAALDVADLDRWLTDPSAPLAELMDHYPFLRTEDEARRFIAKIKVGLDDVRAGRVVPHEQIVQDVEERRRRYRPDAAE